LQSFVERDNAPIEEELHRANLSAEHAHEDTPDLAMYNFGARNFLPVRCFTMNPKPTRLAAGAEGA